MTTDSPARIAAAKLRVGADEVELPIVHGTEGDDAIDIARLRGDTGLITLDPGYGNTGACTSAITFLDGEEGILRYRGYPIEQLAEHSTFLEVAYLLIWGELPTQEQLDRFVSEVTHHTLIREEMRHFFDSFPTDAHPMAVLASGVVGMSTFYPDSQNIFDADAVEITTNRLIAKLPTLAAWSFKKAIGQPYVYPRNDLGYAANLLHMMFAVPTEEYEVDPKVAEALDLLLILHADRVLAATRADDALFEVAKRLEEVALSDEYFVSRKLYPNVDFYSGLIYRAIGFPKNMFTNCFAIGRLPGWIAQWREMMSVRETKIGRPRQVYVGPPTRDYAPIEQRR